MKTKNKLKIGLGSLALGVALVASTPIASANYMGYYSGSYDYVPGYWGYSSYGSGYGSGYYGNYGYGSGYYSNYGYDNCCCGGGGLFGFGLFNWF